MAATLYVSPKLPLSEPGDPPREPAQGAVTARRSVIWELSRPFWVLLSVSFAGILLLAGLLTYAQNQNSIQSSEKLFGAVIEARFDRLGELLLEYGFWDEAVEHLVVGFDREWVESNLTGYIYDTLQVAGAHVVDGDNRTVFSIVEGDLVDDDVAARYGTAVRSLIEDARRTPDDTTPAPASGFILRGSELYAAAALRMTTYFTRDGKEVIRSTDHVMLFLQAIDQAFLDSIAGSYLLPGLRVSSGPVGFWEAGREIRTHTAEPAGSFVWAPSLPGTEMLPKLAAGVAVAFLLMAVTALAFVRRVGNAARALEEARTRADQASTAKSEFLRNLAHEVRTPMNAIVGFSTIMQQEMFGPVENPRYAEYIRHIVDVGHHTLSLVSDLLDLAKIEAGEMAIETAKLDINETIAEVIDFVDAIVQQKRISMEFAGSDRRLEADSDPQKIRQIMLNLLSNAIKFTPEGGSICCRAFPRDDSSLVIEVRDSGPGIRPELIPKVLEPFGQVATKANGNQRGTGLGLPISKRLTEALGGSFAIASTVGEGTTVTLVLPRHVPGAEPHRHSAGR